MGGDRKELSAETRSRMEYLAGLLNEASEAYYARDTEIMSNLEYDRYYDELQALEKESGFVLSGSPTLRVGYAAVDELPRVRHEQPMLSLGGPGTVAGRPDRSSVLEAGRPYGRTYL